MKAGSSSSTRKRSPFAVIFALTERSSSSQRHKVSQVSLTSQRKPLASPYSDLPESLSLPSFAQPYSPRSSHHFSTFGSVPATVAVKRRPLRSKVKLIPVPVWEEGYVPARSLYAKVDSALHRFSRGQNDRISLLKALYENSMEVKSRLPHKREVPRLKRSSPRRDPIVSIYSSYNSPVNRGTLYSPKAKGLATSVTHPKSVQRLRLKLVGQSLNQAL
jgi:hypothetical protein